MEWGWAEGLLLINLWDDSVGTREKIVFWKEVASPLQPKPIKEGMSETQNGNDPGKKILSKIELVSLVETISMFSI